jgi:hypothetical protein
MKYCKNYLPQSLLSALCSLTSDSLETLCLRDQRSISGLLKENFDHVLRLKHSVRTISSYFRHRRVKRTALLKRLRQHVKPIIKIQALVRGHLARIRNAALVKRIRTEGPKKTKKYRMIAKLQANIKGWLFRLRRKRALERLGKGRQELKREMSDSILGDEFEEFDADKFFGIKEENFESGLSLPQEEMMQQMIQMMGMQNRGGPQVRPINVSQKMPLPPGM